MSRYLNNYINLLFSDANEDNFIFYLNEDSLYLNNSLNTTLEKLSERLKNKYAKLPNFRSANKEALAKYKNAIIYFNEQLKDPSISDSDTELLKSIIIIFNYKVYLIKSQLGKKNNKNTTTLVSLATNYIKRKFPKIKIINSRYFYNDSQIDLIVIKNLNDFINASNNIQKQINEKEKLNIYYRGHCNYTYNLVPSIYRDDYINNEHKMYRDILIRNPEEFSHTKSTFEKLTIMQHYGLPTRLLDVTKNPLVALYFACEKSNEDNNPAEVLIFNPSINDIKYYDSDTVCILSNLAKCERTLKYAEREDINTNNEGGRLLHLIKEDKPHFINNIDPKDFNRTLIVKPINNNNRVKRQSGHFFIFGFNQEVTNPSELDCFLKIDKKTIKILIEPNAMKSIMQELDHININRESLFPEIEKGTSYIKEIYNNK